MSHPPFPKSVRDLGALFAALLLAAPLHAQVARPGGNARGTTGTTQGRGGSTSSSGISRTSTGSRQYRSNTELGDAIITIDPETRSLVIVTDEDTHRELSGVIKNLDKPKPQVLIKVVFLEVTYNKSLDVGLEGSYTFNLKSPIPANTGSNTSTTTTTGTTTGTPIVSGAGTTTTNTTNTITNTLTTPLDTVANIGRTATVQNLYGLSSLTQGSFLRLASDDWTATLHALASKGKLEVLSRPSIMARNNQEAVIVVGSEVPFITASSLTSTGQTNNTIRYDNVGIILRVTPFITSEGTVEMIVAPEISNLTDQTVPIGNNTFAPVIAKRSAETVVVTPHAQTVVIGGLMETQKTSNIQKIPVLGDIPVLGAAFRRTVNADVKRELLIFLTPYIINNGEGLEKSTSDEMNRTEMVDRSFTQKELEKYLDTIPVPADADSARKPAGKSNAAKPAPAPAPIPDMEIPKSTPAPRQPRISPR
jgi:general secretion pathway protein D